MKENNYGTINISDLCKKAGVNRSTFYAHYDTLDDLFADVALRYIDRIQSFAFEHKDKPDLYQFFVAFLEDVKTHTPEFTVLLSDRVLIRLHDTIIIQSYNRTKEQIDIPFFQYEPVNSYTYSFMIQGAITTIAYWIKNGMDISIPKMARILANMCEGVINGMKKG